MKKVISLIMVLALCLGLCACGGNSSKGKQTPKEKAVSTLESYIGVQIALRYDTVGPTHITTYVEELGDNAFGISGKVTVQDKYGDSYTGTYDAEVVYNPETDKCDVDLELGTLYKN